MPPHSYPDLSWSGRVSGVMRTLQVVAIALTVGAIGGGIGVLALMGLPGGSPRQPIHADAAKPRTAPSQSATQVQSAPPALAQAPKPPQQVAPAAQPTQPGASQMTAAPARSESTKPTETTAAPVAPAASTLATTRAGSASTTAHKPVETQPRGETRDEARTRAGAPVQAHEPVRAAEKSEPASKSLYDRAAPAESDSSATDRSLSAQTYNHNRLSSKRARKRTVASTPQSESASPQYRSTPPARYAPAGAVPPPPVALVPRQGRAFGDDNEGGWRGRDSGDWRYSRQGPPGGYSDRDDWRDRQRYDDSDRGRGGGGLFGLFFGGGDWRD